MTQIYYLSLIYTFQINTNGKAFEYAVQDVNFDYNPADILNKYNVPLTTFDDIPTPPNE